MKICINQAGRPGFTLLEVMVASCILVMVIIPLLGAMTLGLNTVTTAKNMTIATQLARDKMAEIEMAPFPTDEGTERGQFQEIYKDFYWQTNMFRPPELAILQDQYGIEVMQVYLEVGWEEQGVVKRIILGNFLVR